MLVKIQLFFCLNSHVSLQVKLYRFYILKKIHKSCFFVCGLKKSGMHYIYGNNLKNTDLTHISQTGTDYRSRLFILKKILKNLQACLLEHCLLDYLCTLVSVTQTREKIMLYRKKQQYKNTLHLSHIHQIKDSFIYQTKS